LENAHLTSSASYVADYFGRRIGVAIGLIILFVGTIMQAVPTVNDDMFIAGRFLVGLGYVQLARGALAHR
jgi:MFS family permease